MRDRDYSFFGETKEVGKWSGQNLNHPLVLFQRVNLGHREHVWTDADTHICIQIHTHTHTHTHTCTGECNAKDKQIISMEGITK